MPTSGGIGGEYSYRAAEELKVWLFCHFVLWEGRKEFPGGLHTNNFKYLNSPKRRTGRFSCGRPNACKPCMESSCYSKRKLLLPAGKGGNVIF